MRRVYLALAIIAPIIGAVVMMRPACCQLPPTNMGKYVHQPGDNQYDRAAQQERHGQPAPVMAPVVNQGGGGGGGGNGWVPTPRIPKPDISLEPIVADEPIVAAGFPPMPERVDLPISGGWGRAGGGGYGGAGGGGGGGSSGPPMPTGTHQHYNHYDPGAFIQNKTTNSSNKVNTAPMPGGRVAEQFSAAGNGGNMMSGGIEPRLNPANDRAMPTEAPTAVTIKQSTTQDLSLPDDDFSYKNQNKQNGGNRYLKQMGRSLMMPLQTLPSMAGSGMTSKLRF